MSEMMLELAQFVNRMVTSGYPVVKILSETMVTFQGPREVDSTFSIFYNKQESKWMIHIPYMDAHPDNHRLAAVSPDNALKLIKSNIPA